MSSLFYIWDAKQHHPDVKITTLEQAEYDSIFKKSVFSVYSHQKDVLAQHKYSDDTLNKKMMDEAELKLEKKHAECFPAGTRVHTDKGLVPIQEIKVGDMVLSKPESGEGELCYKPVVRTVSYENKEVWQLTYFEVKADTDISKLNKGKLLQLSRKGKMVSNVATPNHPFWVKGVGWTRLDELKNGQIIETYDSETIALVFMVNPLRKTTMQNVAGIYHPSNIFDADKKGFEIEDVEFFSLVEYGSEGLIRMVGNGNQPSPINVDGENIDIYSELFSLNVYNFEVSDHHTYFISQKGLWVHNTNCADASPNLLPEDLVIRSGETRPTQDTQGRSIDVYVNKAGVYDAFNGVQNGESGITIVKRAIGNDTGKNDHILPLIICDQNVENSIK